MTMQKMKTLDDVKGYLGPFLVPAQGLSGRASQCLPQIPALQHKEH